MSELSKIGNKILQECIACLEERGLRVVAEHPEEGALTVQNPERREAKVSLINLVQQYCESRDAHGVRDFVDTVFTLLSQSGANPAWHSVKDKLYGILTPDHGDEPLPFGKNLTGYAARIFVIDQPDSFQWVLPEMAEAWGVDKAALERQAAANADDLLDETMLYTAHIDGHPFGSFDLDDPTLCSALLLAPGLKKKVQRSWGWPLYAIIPNQITCNFFGKADLAYFRQQLGTYVAEKYEHPKFISPQLLEFSDSGIRSLCSWTKKMGYVVKFEND